MPTDTPPPRRNWHFNRWLVVLIIATLGWSGWRAYAFRSALAQAKALGWPLAYTDPVEEIRKNWKAAFTKETWLDGVTLLIIPTGEDLEQNLAIVHRLNPIWLTIGDASTLHDLSGLTAITRLQALAVDACTGLTNLDSLKNPSLKELRLAGGPGLKDVDALKHLSSLQDVSLIGCTGLTNVDALKHLSSLRWVWLEDCTGLTNVDGLIHLSTLQIVRIQGCTGLTEASISALRAANPDATIDGP